MCIKFLWSTQDYKFLTEEFCTEFLKPKFFEFW